MESTSNSPTSSSSSSLHTPSPKRIRVIKSPQITISSNPDNSPQAKNKKSLQLDSQASDTYNDTIPNSTAMPSQRTSGSDIFVQMYTELYEVRAEWYNIGLALGVQIGDLDAIEVTDKNDCKICLRKMLQLRNNTKKLTWTEIIEALKDSLVEKNSLADSIQRKYAPKGMSQNIPEPSTPSTPECALSIYTSFLKHKYTDMPIFPDNWPPPLKEKTTKLALVERNKENSLPTGEHTQSIEHDYATGNVDNIATRKQEIKLKDIFNHLPREKSQLNRFVVVMDGAPGVGKTTLTRKICIDWAEGKLLTNHQIVILKQLRKMRGQTITSLSDILQADDPELKEQVIKHIQKTSGSGVMFIFDGFDELSSEQRFDKSTLFWELVKGNKFHKCSVLVTSRSYASDPLWEVSRVNRYVEVLGFKKKEIEHCIKQNIDNKEKAEALIQILKERLDIVSLCYIPLNCRIVLYVYKQENALPKTLTEIYKKFILYTIKHYKNKIHVVTNKDDIQKANSIDQLPEKLRDYLRCLAKLAYEGLAKNKLVFEYVELKPEETSQLEFDEILNLGLLNIIGGVESYHYQFLHLTIQEFLAARHLASVMNNEELMEFFSTNLSNDRFRMTLIFLSGLTHLNFLPSDQPFLFLDKALLKIQLKLKEFEKIQQQNYLILQLAHILYESQQKTNNWILNCLPTNSLDMSLCSLTQFDCLVLANFLAMIPEGHVLDEINLSECQLTDDCLILLLTKNHTKQAIPVLFLSKELNLSLIEYTGTDLFTPMLESKVESLTISSNNLPECKNFNLSGKNLKKILIYDDIRYEILISNNQIIISGKICSGIFQKLLQHIPINCLRQLCITSVPSDQEVCSYCDSFRATTLCKCMQCFRFEQNSALECCPDCGGSEDDAWKSVTNIDMKHCRKIHIMKTSFSEDQILFLCQKLTDCKNLYLLQMESENNIPLNISKLISLQQSTQIRIEINLQNALKFSMSTKNDKFVHIEIEKLNNPTPWLCKNYQGPEDTALKELSSILPSLLEEDLPPDLHGVTVTTISHMSSVLLTSLEKTKTVKHLTLSNLIICNIDYYLNEHNYYRLDYLFFSEFKNILENSKTLQTLMIDNCALDNTCAELLKKGLSSNTTISLQNLKSIHQDHKDWYQKHLISTTILTCQQVQAIEVNINKNDETFFNALSRNRGLTKLTINTSKDMLPILFQTILSTSITDLKVDCINENGINGIEGSLAFKQLVNENRMLTVLIVNNCELTDEAFDKIKFKKESPLVKLSITEYENTITNKGWTHLFNSLCSSHITTLDISGSADCIIIGSDRYEALKNLLVSNECLTVLIIGEEYYHKSFTDTVSCISEALSQNCYLQELKIIKHCSHDLIWTKIFQSIHHNSTLQKLTCHTPSIAPFSKGKEEITSLCEMLEHNKGLKSLIINDHLIKGHLKEFVKAYIERQPVLNLTVGSLDIALLEEIEKIRPNNDYSHYIRYNKLCDHMEFSSID